MLIVEGDREDNTCSERWEKVKRASWGGEAVLTLTMGLINAVVPADLLKILRYL